MYLQYHMYFQLYLNLIVISFDLQVPVSLFFCSLTTSVQYRVKYNMI